MRHDSPPPSLPTTSYAILGMLALRPWTAYELTRQLRRSLSYCWPKAESVLYEEPKRLVRLGLATAQREPAGRRTRTAYAITGEGRRALGAWLATRPGPPRFEFETMLRLVYADQGSKEELLDAVRAARRWAEGRYEEGREQVRGYLDGGGPFPDRLHIIALFARFYADLFELVIGWAELAEAEIARWPRTGALGMTERTRVLLEELASRGQAGQAAERAPSGAPEPGGSAR
jgi:PadR family transcriptional regulator, regulatory protein AphA